MIMHGLALIHRSGSQCLRWFTGPTCQLANRQDIEVRCTKACITLSIQTIQSLTCCEDHATASYYEPPLILDSPPLHSCYSQCIRTLKASTPNAFIQSTGCVNQ